MCGLAIAATIRGSCRRRPSAAWSAPTRRRRRAGRAARGSWSSEPSSRMSTSMPVRIRNGASSLVELGDDVELLAQPLRRQPVGDRQPRRVVGERDVLVAEVARGQRHLLDRRAAVGPVRVRVQVAAQRRPQRRAAGGHRRRRRRPPACARYAGTSPGRRLGDHRGGHVADALQLVSVPARDALARSSAVGRPSSDRGRGAEGLDPVGRLAGAARAGTRSGAAPSTRAPPVHRPRLDPLRVT